MSETPDITPDEFDESELAEPAEDDYTDTQAVHGGSQDPEVES